VQKSIKSKLLARFGVVGVVLVAAALVVTVLAGSVERQAMANLDLAVESARLAGEIDYDVAQVQGWLTDISATRAAEGFDDGFSEAATWAEAFRSNVAALVALHPEQAGPMAELTETFDGFYAAGQEMAQAYIDGGPAAGNAMMADFDAAAESMRTSLEAVHADIDSDIVAMKEDVAAATGLLTNVTLVGSLATLVGLAFVALRTANAISRPLEQMAAAASVAAAGDTSVVVDHTSEDELGRLADALRSLTGYLQGHATTASAIADGNIDVAVVPMSDRDTLGMAMARMVDTLGDLLGAVRTATVALARQSDELSNASSDLSAGSESVAATITHLAGAAVEQTSAADQVNANVLAIVEELAELALLNSSIIAATDGAVAQTIQGAENVAVIHETMRSTVDAIDEAASMVDDLGQRSEQVSQAVMLIQQIADQTNLLALNAAIEAARAGEAGRGFAVVATEVKQLAEQAGSSAGQIGEIVSAMANSVHQVVASTEVGRQEVRRGAELIDGLESDLTAIRLASQSVLDDVRNASGRVGVIQNAAGGIVDRIGDLSQAAESNAAATEEVAASSEESAATADEVQRSAQALGDVAGSLQSAVGAFSGE
jgi:methyl-accepting chemotaxis protein